MANEPAPLLKRAREALRREGIGATLARTLRSVRRRARQALPEGVKERLDVIEATRPLRPRECSLCGYVGPFRAFGSPPRPEARCPSCRSLERHRLFKLAFDRGHLAPGGRYPGPVIHFAPEPLLQRLVRDASEDYRSADLFQQADLQLNLEAIDLPDGSVATVIANHVLEHVDDRQAAREIFRVLRPGGRLIASVPIVEGWAETYENPAAASPEERRIHFGQEDHVRFFGRDFRDRIMAAGFSVQDEVTAEGEDVIRYGLIRGEKVFIFTK